MPPTGGPAGVPGCCACGPTEHTITLTVLGCNGNGVAGATVQLRNATGLAVLDTGTTDSSGVVVFVQDPPTANTYNVLISATNWVTKSQTIGSPVNRVLTTSVTLEPDATLVCVPCSPRPMPRTLPMTTGISSDPLNRGVSDAAWNLTVTHTRTSDCFGVYTETAPIGFTLNCLTATTVRLTVGYYRCAVNNNFSAFYSSGQPRIEGLADRTVDWSQPVNLSFTWPGDFVTSGGLPVPQGTHNPQIGTITITE